MDPAPQPAPANQPSSTRIRRFKRFILLATLAAVALTIASFRVGRYYAVETWNTVRRAVIYQVTGLTPDRAEIEADWKRRRNLTLQSTEETLRKFYDGTDENMRALFRVAGMDPEHGLVRYGRADQTFLISSKVFERDDSGRSYRFLPNTRSIWLRQVVLLNGPFSLLLVPNTPEVREAAGRAGAIVDEPSATTTNSWGLRGPEPDPSAPLRGVILGDSFMQGMFSPDDQTPPVHLARRLSELRGTAVSVANTGHMGYSPEQYFYSLKEYGERMKPHFVVVSVCPNDFGSEFDILQGRPDWIAEAEYWIEQIYGWCRARNVTCLVVPIPSFPQVESTRKDGFYPGLVNNIFHGPPASYCDPLERFINENLKLKIKTRASGGSFSRSPLYNRHIDDEHLSPKGAEVWADVVAERLSLWMTATADGSPAPPPPSAVTSGSSASEPRQ
ncbi:SGNH/GDSL hydrolase family protein [Paludisphaera rhizosphaerae]|uniref:SGNH/GDSL hydrolase family protein n=1 Tax=Paludisphaera rhizosphaerae TaxID=2711216 RepID=UPI0013EAF6DA|nr:SGNH/GDSL hydrolase family protein [Paludisphaera rhizosphaerae]